MTVVFWSTPEPMWLYLTPQHDGFLCSAIWGLKGHAHSPEVSCLALHVLRFLWNSLNLFTILCMVVVKRHKFFAILHWEMWFLVIWHLSHEIWHKVMNHDPALLAKTEMLLLYPNMIPWPITNAPTYCELFQNSLIWIFYNLFIFI